MLAEAGQHMGVNGLLAVRLSIIQVRNLVVLDTHLTRGSHTRSTSHVHYRLTKDWQSNASLQLLPEAGAERTLEAVSCKALLNEALRAVSTTLPEPNPILQVCNAT